MPNPTIGRVAKPAGVNVETIRFYQRRKLLAEPTKPLGGSETLPCRNGFAYSLYQARAEARFYARRSAKPALAGRWTELQEDA